jgi:hypothetical protein
LLYLRASPLPFQDVPVFGLIFSPSHDSIRRAWHDSFIRLQQRWWRNRPGIARRDLHEFLHLPDVAFSGGTSDLLNQLGL